jgi:hypothetical protein
MRYVKFKIIEEDNQVVYFEERSFFRERYKIGLFIFYTDKKL